MLTDKERDLIIKLWEANVPERQIVNSLPFNVSACKKEIEKMKEENILPKRNRGENTVQKILTAYKSGITNPYVLAETYGYSIHTINNILVGAKLQRTRPEKNHKKRKVLITENQKKIISEIQSGRSLASIARDFGVSRQRVFAIKKKHLGGCESE